MGEGGEKVKVSTKGISYRSALHGLYTRINMLFVVFDPHPRVG